jgi:hypothetical protein
MTLPVGPGDVRIFGVADGRDRNRIAKIILKNQILKRYRVEKADT